MKTYQAALAAFFALVSQATAAPIVSGFSSYLPSSPSQIYAPPPTYTNNGFGPFGYSTNPPSLLDPPGTTYVGLTQTYLPFARSPFEDVSGFENAPYDSVSANGFACFGECGLVFASQLAKASSATSVTFAFIYGSPDSYNTLSIFDDAGQTDFTGSQLVDPTIPKRLGYEFITISGIENLQGIQFASAQNAFEFAFVSAVPLPAALPMFGAGLLALAGFGYGLNRKKAASAA